MNYENNFYSYPENSGLEIVAEIEYSDRNYNFDTRVVWKHIESGLVYTARSSGCSCPMPFEEFDTIDDLEVVIDVDIFRREFDELGYQRKNVTFSEMQEFLEKVRAALK